MKKYFVCILSYSLLFSTFLSAQHLKPGFNKAEYIDMLRLTARFADSVTLSKSSIPEPRHFKFNYRSPAVGLDNMWELWLSDDSIAVISIRGTTGAATSWLVNLYAAMVPAKGSLQLDKSFTFNYNLSEDAKAAVHVGFLVSTAYLSRDILPKIDSCYKNLGIKEFIITGHSQGGAITFLLTSYLMNLRSEGRIPADIRFKTYSGAPPKVGNLFYAYQFESLTRNWAYSVVNSADWVPEVPMSIQTLEDFNNANPFRHAKQLIKKQGFPKNLALRHVYNRLSKPPKRAQRRYERWLGKTMSKAIRKHLPEFVPPVYFKSNNYVRTGTPIVLYADADYYRLFPEDVNQIWTNHMMPPFLYLAEKLPDPDAAP